MARTGRPFSHSTPQKIRVWVESEATVGQAQLEDRVSLGQHLTDGQQAQLRHVVWEFADIFSEALGRARGARHKIITPEGEIVGEVEEDTVSSISANQRKLNKMLEQGVTMKPLEESDHDSSKSRWNTLVEY